MANPVLIARAPMRIGLGGGGTDLPSYYGQHTGMVLNLAINKYIYVMVQPASQPGTQVVSAGYGAFQQWADDQMFWGNDLALPRAVLEYMGEPHDLDILIASGVPPGTGLGSSGAVGVAMLTALYGWEGQQPSPAEIAEAACEIEISRMGMPVGKQDQYASAFGGFNQIWFYPDHVEVHPLILKPETQTQLEQRLMLFYTGQARASSSILTKQDHDTRIARPKILATLLRLKEIAGGMVRTLKQDDLDDFAALLHMAWKYKKRLNRRVSNPLIEEAYKVARAAGAAGGKVSGAGGGGFLLLYAKERYQDAITSQLGTLGLIRLEFAPAWQGAAVVGRHGMAKYSGGTYALSVLGTIEMLPHGDIAWLAYLITRAQRIFIMGNGGSASTASHMALDLAKAAGIHHVLSLVDSIPTLTAWANDQGYEDVFAEQLRMHEVREGDLVIAISASGNSANVLHAIELANERGAKTAGLVGFDGGKLCPIVDHVVHVKNDYMRQVEDIHLMIAHIVTGQAKELKHESSRGDNLPHAIGT